MKIQIQKGSNNRQESSDDNTLQIQIGTGAVVRIVIAVTLSVGLIIYWLVN